MEIEPIAHIRTNFDEKFGIPRQSNLVDSVGKIVFEKRYRDPEALRGIEGFSHLWLIFDFSENHRESWSPTVRPPRLGGNVRVGVFASRSPFRPNSLGLSSVKLLSIEHDDEFGDILVVEGVDMMDGTPIYDIKPYIRFSDCHEDAVSGFSDNVLEHSLKVEYDDEMLSIFTDAQRDELIGCLQQDPRPSYQDDGKEYGMSFAGHNVRFMVMDGILKISDVE
ncbi:MAG: tRNA (N6-threonylcarbamoyladenosine(37)-N6)-methyltransferase TrmO [Methanomassiliicoccales archaeon]|uniref:tRNA (N6-threonylcarbamoyladenosine(37)-N6)-methyltransferase TrmO n=1 Tax=Candidatus Methanarcanum hacksteinii TaxID=2911857 RepID=UPI002A77C746|nr:tRNA (N6-threonylcarbamoyladenosine(37)-N6)-methyltransferase TrmO [Candidatus Methanomethylophilaceae archaeon]MCI6025426.1 tRNA (N6-threonylcarbamoyladenosine(37)-N6)-methyltransferase TrmO [Methanomassiliicoccales archaeon]MDD7479124.1 tRNA (N6-threonylcarbamoyladenosine(37)-N6)-methyltransferase TrmO [Methanomassiliicoccales archaeon]MDY4580993.1 tRNA (N6-threonylcarbamoyladenosine(37)-N6)-methyltransferase TrmO [Candidatus Methanarcanum hacksteinii]